MSKKRDPALTVFKYFQEAELPVAQLALSLAQQILRERTGKAASPRLRPPAPKKTPGPVTTVGES